MSQSTLAAAAVAALFFGSPMIISQDAEAAPKSKAFSTQSGVASWYSMGVRTASGARYNPDGLSAAHRTLPFGTRVLVSNKRTGKSVTVTINDRGPFIGGRIIDMSRGAARVLGMIHTGTAPVTVQVTPQFASAK